LGNLAGITNILSNYGYIKRQKGGIALNSIKKSVLKITVTSIALLLILGSSIGYANTSFTDVSSNHWAMTYITKMNNAGIITGFDDGTYKPNLDVPVSQAIVMMVRLIEPDQGEINTALSIYSDLLEEVGVEGWAKNQMAYGLLKGIITEEELRDSYVNAKVRTAKKLEICRYLTRALGLEDEAKGKEIIVLGFNDNIMIPDEDKPYVSMMIDIGVIDQYGDVLGNFNPEGSMNRAIMAKILSVALDYREEIKMEEFAKYNKDVVGTIEDIQYGTTPKLIVMDSTGTTHEHILSETVEITKGTDKISVLDLRVGDSVDIKVVDDFITKINHSSTIKEQTEEDVEGVISSILITNKIEISIKGQDGVEKSYRLASHNFTILDQKTMSILDLRAGYPAKLKVVNNGWCNRWFFCKLNFNIWIKNQLYIFD